MNQEVTNALQKITGNTRLDEVSVDQLQQLAASYPYFSTVQLLLCKKMQHEKHPGLQQQLFKTALYFPNEPWLRYLLLETKPQAIQTEIEPETHIDNLPSPESVIALNDIQEYKTEDKKADVAELENVLIATEEQEEISSWDISKNSEEVPETETLPSEDANLITLPAEGILQEVPTFNVQDEPEEAPLDEEEIAQQTTEPLPVEESNQKIASLLSEQAEAFHKSVEAGQPLPIETEPYHTVDYFASQGIRLDGKKEETGFDKKVHKFTDWLRQMKRINPHPVDLGTDAEEESHIANIAASSNQTREVLTESMAEVLVKQGKHGKATEIYEKLSLLYPSKNAYFAAKIQQLKS